MSRSFCRDNNLHLGRTKIILVNLRVMYMQSLTLKNTVEIQGPKSNVQLKSKATACSDLSAKESLLLLLCLLETELAWAGLHGLAMPIKEN